MVLLGNHRALARAGVSSLQPFLPQHLARRLAGHPGCGCCGCSPPRHVGVSPQSYRPALLARSLSEQRARSCGSCSAKGWLGIPGSGLLRIPSPQASLHACPPLLEHPRGALSMRQPRTHATPTTGWPQPLWGLPSHSCWAGRGGRRRLQKQGRRAGQLSRVQRPANAGRGDGEGFSRTFCKLALPPPSGSPARSCRRKAEAGARGSAPGGRPASAAPELAESGRGGGGGGVGPPPAVPRTKAEPWERNAARAPRRPRPLAPRGRRPGHPLGLMNPPLCGTVTPR